MKPVPIVNKICYMKRTKMCDMANNCDCKPKPTKQDILKKEHAKYKKALESIFELSKYIQDHDFILYNFQHIHRLSKKALKK